MSYERLSPADTVFLRIETAHEPQHVGSLSVLDGAPLRDGEGRLRFDELVDHVDRRSRRVPRMRQKVMEVPFGQGRPVWVDDDRFDIGYHVRLTALPRPGDDEQLATLMSRLQSLPLDRERPLWEMWFIDGLADDRVGMVIKTHHALGDGIANVDLALALVDLDPDPPADEPVDEWVPRPAPLPGELLADSLVERAATPLRLMCSTVRAVVDPRPALTATADVVRTAYGFLAKPAPAPWNVPVSPHRRWVHADVELESVRRVREHHEGTLNDVVLAACTGALREFMTAHDVDVAGRTLKAMVPVSTRTDSERGGTLGNRVSLIVVDLPVDEPDPVARLDRIRARTAELKGSGLVEGAETILRLADELTPVAAPLTRFVSRQIPMNLVITNIPGPPVPLYLRGARILRTYPYVEVVDDEGLTIAVVSYEDRLHFGITSDRDVLPDLQDLADAVERALDALVDAAAGRSVVRSEA